jgi:hypothetical protein
LVIDPDQLNNGYVKTTTAAQNDGIEYKFSAQAGDFDLNLLTVTSAGCGIFTVYVDGVGQGDIDLYSSGAVDNVLGTLEIVTTTSGSHVLGLKVEDKNAEASGYCANVNAWWLTDHPET